MKPVKNAKRIAWRSYSIWLNRLAFGCMILPEVIYITLQIDTNPRIWFFLGAALYVAVEVARYIKQESISGPDVPRSPALVMVAALFMAMAQVPDHDRPAPQGDVLDVAVPLIAKWEGLRTTAYQDIVGVWTVCYGETKGVRPGDTYSKAECRAMLAREVREYWQGWRAYLTPETLSERLHAAREAAYTSLAYNVGVRAAGRSTATRRLNAGNVAGGCEAIGWWNRAGDRVVRGLVNRRADEVALCRIGLA